MVKAAFVGLALALGLNSASAQTEWWVPVRSPFSAQYPTDARDGRNWTGCQRGGGTHLSPAVYIQHQRAAIAILPVTWREETLHGHPVVVVLTGSAPALFFYTRDGCEAPIAHARVRAEEARVAREAALPTIPSHFGPFQRPAGSGSFVEPSDLRSPNPIPDSERRQMDRLQRRQ